MATKKKETKPLWFVRVDGPSRNDYNPESGEIYKTNLHTPFLVQPKDFEYFRKRLHPKKCFVELGVDLPEQYTKLARSGKEVPAPPEEERKKEEEQAEKDALKKGSPGLAANQVQAEAPAPDAPADAPKGEGEGSE